MNSDVIKPEKTGRSKDERKKTFLKKLLPAVLLSLAAPFTVCIFGPFDIYSGNLREFLFSLGDFLPYTLPFAGVAAVVIFLSLIFLRGIAFDIGCATVTWLSLMLFVQRTYLNLLLGGSFLEGDGNNTLTLGAGAIAVNTAIWLAVGAAIIVGAILLRKKSREIVGTVVTIAMIALIGMQAVTLGITCISTNVLTPILDRQEGQKILTYDGVDKLSEGKNIVFFLVDRFDANYYEDMIKKDPEFFSELDGFTHFSDYTSLYARTYPAVASILTGKDHDYFGAERPAAFERFYGDGGGMLGVLKENGYSVNLYTEKGYVYNDASVMDDYVDNTKGLERYTIDNNFTLARDMILLSLSQYLPVAARGWSSYLSTPTFNDHALYESTEDEMFAVNSKATASLLQRIEESGMETVDGEGRFTFIHLYGCHDISKSSIQNIENTFTLIYYYIDQMKALGVYEDATIIITGDHAAALDDYKVIGDASDKDDGTRVTAMLFKRSGDYGTPLATSTAQISQDELWATIWESEGLTEEKRGESFFDVPEGVDRKRRYIFEVYRSSKKNGFKYNRLYEYEIIGNANEGDSWNVIRETDIIK